MGSRAAPARPLVSFGLLILFPITRITRNTQITQNTPSTPKTLKNMEQDPYLGRYYVGRRYLRECRLYRVLDIYMPPGYGVHYRCDTLEYSGDNVVGIEHHLIDSKEAGDIFKQEISDVQYQRGIDLFYKSLLHIRQHIISLKGIPCDHIQAGKAYRLFDQLYFNVNQNPKDGHTESQYLEVFPSEVAVRRASIPSSLVETNLIYYEEIDPTDAQKAVKQFELLYATVRNYINSLVQEEPAIPDFRPNQ